MQRQPRSLSEKPRGKSIVERREGRGEERKGSVDWNKKRGRRSVKVV